MVDRIGNVVRKGDCVRYWHKVNGKSTPEIGEVVEFLGVPGKMTRHCKIERKVYNNTNISWRTQSGITKISKSEAVLWKMEQFVTDDGM